MDPLPEQRGHTRRVNLFMSEDLAARAKKLAEETGTTLSEVVRRALEAQLASRERAKLREELAEECRTFFGDDRALAEEWRSSEPIP